MEKRPHVMKEDSEIWKRNSKFFVMSLNISEGNTNLAKMTEVDDNSGLTIVASLHYTYTFINLLHSLTHLTV